MLPLVTLYSLGGSRGGGRDRLESFSFGDTFSAFSASLESIGGIVPLEVLEDDEALLLAE